MIRKIFILILVVAAAFIFYKKLIAPTIEPFFKGKERNVDLLQFKISDDVKN
jgi:hypothetical protein